MDSQASDYLGQPVRILQAGDQPGPREGPGAGPWRRPGRSQDRHQHSSGQQAVTGGARLLHDEAYLTSGVTLYGVTTGPL